MEAIVNAKKELNAIGALCNNKVTELGHKIVKIPVSVQLARMIVEAEKYGVTEQVMIIAAIIEMGGLLSKEGSYLYFTHESKSDLLAELDVWNTINKMGYIDFKNLGIKKKTFFKIKEHIQKLKESVYGIVEITNNDDREAVVKSCLCGLVSHIYVKNYDRYRSEDGIEVQLDRNSCLSNYPNLIVGIPKTIEGKNRYGRRCDLNLVSFASQIDLNTLFELVPNSIVEEKRLRYSRSIDAVEITIKRSFAGILVDTEIKYDNAHPEYSKLKAEYEEELKWSNDSVTHNSANQQEVVVIDGRQFKVHYSFFDKGGVVYIDNETLFTTNIKELYLDSGEKVHFCSDPLIRRKETNIVALKNAVEMKRLNRIR